MFRNCTHVTCRSHSQVMCCGSSYDGVERSLGEAFARSVVDEGCHDDVVFHTGRDNFHQLPGSEMKIRVVYKLYAVRK